VDRVFFRALTEEDRAELNLLFGHFVVEKVVRTGCLRRPKLKGDERKALDSVIEAFYADIRKRRNERIEETGKAY
jgi:hypothetical protein